MTEGDDEIRVTHIILAAVHINEQPNNITLNEDPPDAPQNERLWEEVTLFQDIGVKVLCMLGGAATGTYQRLDADDTQFELYYLPLRDMVRRHALDGIDLDVEEDMSLAGIVRLIDRLKADFGDGFLVTLAPVATALQGLPHLSGFDYEALEVMRGRHIAWYNTQFYNNWGNLEAFAEYHQILARGFDRRKVVIGVLTHPASGHGYIEYDHLQRIVGGLWSANLGGVFGWEYYTSRPGDSSRPWEWAHGMHKLLTDLQTVPYNRP